MEDRPALMRHLDALHTTPRGALRIQKNVCPSLPPDEVVAWCQARIASPHAVLTRRGKNWYVDVDGCLFTIHAGSYTLITAHRLVP